MWLNKCEVTSGFVFLEPGQYDNVKINQLMACLELSLDILHFWERTAPIATSEAYASKLKTEVKKSKARG